VENSLQRLETDYIDVYQFHMRDWDAELEESLAAMTDLQRAGKIRVIGASATIPLVRQALEAASARVLSSASILSRRVEAAYCPPSTHGVGVMVYAPPAGDGGTGIVATSLPAGSRAGRLSRLEPGYGATRGAEI
jgi:aryl-alcohol dehydrogenase-like predicted oxidoreductase